MNGTVVKPEAGAAAIELWNTSDHKAQLSITSALELEQMQHIVTCGTSHEMWERLHAIHQQKTKSSKHLLLRRFYKMDMEAGDSMATHISKVESLARELRDIEENITDDQIMTCLINSLPSSFDSFISAWESVSEDRRTKQNLTDRLLKEDYMKRARQVDQADTIRHEDTGAFVAGKSGAKKGKCHNCKQSGHWWRDCPSKKKDGFSSGQRQGSGWRSGNGRKSQHVREKDHKSRWISFCL